MSKEWYEESPQEFAEGFTESAGTHHTGGISSPERRHQVSSDQTHPDEKAKAKLEAFLQKDYGGVCISPRNGVLVLGGYARHRLL